MALERLTPKGAIWIATRLGMEPAFAEQEALRLGSERLGMPPSWLTATPDPAQPSLYLVQARAFEQEEIPEMNTREILEAGLPVYATVHERGFMEAEQVVRFKVAKESGFDESELVAIWINGNQWEVRLVGQERQDEQHDEEGWDHEYEWGDDDETPLGPDESAAYWMGGLFSSGGYFGVHRSKNKSGGWRYHPYIQFEGTREVCDYLVAVAGCGKVIPRQPEKDRYRWSVTGAEATDMMLVLKPNVIGPKATQLGKVLAEIEIND